MCGFFGMTTPYLFKINSAILRQLKKLHHLLQLSRLMQIGWARRPIAAGCGDNKSNNERYHQAEANHGDIHYASFLKALLGQLVFLLGDFRLEFIELGENLVERIKQRVNPGLGEIDNGCYIFIGIPGLQVRELIVGFFE